MLKKTLTLWLPIVALPLISSAKTTVYNSKDYNEKPVPAKKVWVLGGDLKMMDKNGPIFDSANVCHSELRHYKNKKWQRTMVFSAMIPSIHFPKGFGLLHESEPALNGFTVTEMQHVIHGHHHHHHRKKVGQAAGPVHFEASMKTLPYEEGVKKGLVPLKIRGLMVTVSEKRLKKMGIDMSKNRYAYSLASTLGPQHLNPADEFYHWPMPPGRHTFKSHLGKAFGDLKQVRLHTIAAHIHEHSMHMYLKDTTANKIVWETHVEKDQHGNRVMPNYESVKGIELNPNHEFELGATYENNTGEEIDSMIAIATYYDDRPLVNKIAFNSTDKNVNTGYKGSYWMTGGRVQLIDKNGPVKSTARICHIDLFDHKEGQPFRRAVFSGLTPEIQFPEGYGLLFKEKPGLFGMTVDKMMTRFHGHGNHHQGHHSEKGEVTYRAEMDTLSYEEGERRGLKPLNGRAVFVSVSDQQLKKMGVKENPYKTAQVKVLGAQPNPAEEYFRWPVPPGKHKFKSYAGKPFAHLKPLKIHAIAAHIHEYGDHIYIKNLTTGKVLWESTPIKNAQGNTVMKLYSDSEGLEIKNNHEFEVGGSYNNTSGRTIDSMISMTLFFDDNLSTVKKLN